MSRFALRGKHVAPIVEAIRRSNYQDLDLDCAYLTPTITTQLIDIVVRHHYNGSGRGALFSTTDILV